MVCSVTMVCSDPGGCVQSTDGQVNDSSLQPEDKLDQTVRSRSKLSASQSAGLQAEPLRVDLPSIVDIKRAIPNHCFESSLMTSLYFVVKDFCCITALYWLSELTWAFLPALIQVAVTPVYWFLSGTFMWALFVLGHEAGHGSFSRYAWINDIVGNICHGCIMLPYYMWKLTHRHHHKNTGNIDKEEIFYPVRRKDLELYMPAGKRLSPGFGLGFAWFGYLIKGYSPRPVSHFDIWHPMFVKHFCQCCMSLAVMVAWSGCLLRYAQVYGAGALAYHYLAPVFVFACYLVVVTFLHHADVDTPWYSDSVWTYVRGQLSSVDRDYGWCHNLTHNIGTHQIHHLFPMIPHYHLEEATSAFRTAFPKLVRKSDDRILPAFWKNFKIFSDQHIIDDDTITHVFKKH